MDAHVHSAMPVSCVDLQTAALNKKLRSLAAQIEWELLVSFALQL